MQKKGAIVAAFLLWFFLLSSALASAESDEILETAELLFIKEGRLCEVYLDGQHVGATPLLLSIITENNSILELRGERLYSKAFVKFNPEISSVTYFQPTLEPYYGFLAVDAIPEEASIFLDGELIGTSSITNRKLLSKTYKLMITADGYFPIIETVEVPKLESRQLSFSLSNTVSVVLDPPPPIDSTIECIEEFSGQVASFVGDESILLPKGSWLCSVNSHLFRRWERQIEVEEQPIRIPFDPDYYRPTVKIDDLRKDSRVFLNGKDVTDTVQSEVITVDIGTYVIEVILDQYMPFTTVVEPVGDEMLVITPAYTRDSSYLRSVSIAGFGVAGAGLAMTTASLIMNADGILFQLAPSYETYRAFKYGTLLAAGVGIAVSITGAAIGFTASGTR